MPTIEDIRTIFNNASAAGHDLLQVCQYMGIDPNQPNIANLLASYMPDEDVIYRDANWTLTRSIEPENQIFQWSLESTPLEFSVTWGWSEFPEEEELALVIEQFNCFQKGETDEITFSSTFHAHLSSSGFRVETGDAEFKFPVHIGYVFFQDLTGVCNTV